MKKKNEPPDHGSKKEENEGHDESFYLKILKDPFIVADLYSRPEDGDICEPLVRALEDPDELVRMAAVTSLTALDDLYASSEIFWMVVRGSAHARLSAIRVLARIGQGDEMSIRHLIVAMSDPDRMVRIESRNALTMMGIDVESLPRLPPDEHPLVKKKPRRN